MKNIRKITALVLCLFCALSVQLPASAAAEAAVSEPNITKYIPYPHSAADIDKAHTVHWAQGIEPPTMPGQILDDGSIVEMKKADFTMIDVNDNPTTPETNKTDFGYYVAEYQAGKGWYDSDKNHFYAPERNINDENACYALAASNVISWWLDRSRSRIEQYLELAADPDTELMVHEGLADPLLLRGYLDSQKDGFPSTDPKYSMVYKTLLDGFHSINNYDGGYIHGAMDPFFNGYMPAVIQGPNTPDRFTPFKDGGFFYPVFGLSTLTYESWYTRYDVLNSSFKGYFDEGYGVAIGYRHLGGAHAVSVWGAEYDENDNLCGLYITDSNDAGDTRLNYRNWDKKPCIASLRRYDCYGDTNGITAIGSNKTVNPAKGSFLYSVCILDTAQEEWDYFLENHVPMYSDNRPLVTYDDYITPVKTPPAPQWSLAFSDSIEAFPQGEIGLGLEVKCSLPGEKATLIVGTYDESGRQIDIKAIGVSADGSSAKQVTVDNSDGKISYAKAFLLDSDFIPLTKAAGLLAPEK